MTQPEPKCGACQRTTATHAPGCSLITRPHRRPQVWDCLEGAQGFPGLMAEERVLIRRRSERERATSVSFADL